ncbi:MAG: hypothetical protein RL417_1251 [Pseudomonadota bacterium]
MLKCFACAGAVYVAAAAARSVLDGESPPPLWTLGMFFLAAPAWIITVRSHVVTYVLLGTVILLFERYRKSRPLRAIIVIPLLFVPWINSHGGFVVGLGYLGVMALGLIPFGRTAVVWGGAVTALALAAALINPYGFGYLIFIFEAVTMPRPYVTEWYPPSFGEVRDYPFFAVLLLLIIGVLTRPRNPRLDSIGMLFLSGFAAAAHARLIPVFGLFAAVYGWPIVRHLFFSGSSRWWTLRPALHHAAAFVFLLGVVPWCGFQIFQSRRVGETIFDTELYPRRAFDWLWATGATGKLLVDFDRGSFALWRLYPRFQISLDGRYEEVYPNSTIELVVAAFDPQSPRHRAAFEQIKPTEILVDNAHQGYRDAAIFGADWGTVYRDERYAILSERRFSSQQLSDDPVWAPRFEGEPFSPPGAPRVQPHPREDSPTEWALAEVCREGPRR